MKLPYELLEEAFIAAVEDYKFANDPRIGIIRGQTGMGKTFLQDREMPVILKNVFPDLKYIIRVSPTTEVADDGTFVNVDLLSDDETLYQYYDNLDPTTVRNIESLSKRTGIVACVSVTHSYFSLHFDRILELAPNAVVVLEEAHQYVGCGDKGGEAYVTTYGYHSQYKASTIDNFFKWAEVNPRIIGFTATVTKHHEGDKSLTDRFWICNEMPKKESLIASQAWLGNVIEYPFVKASGRNSISKYIGDSIEEIRCTESKLARLQEFDSNIVCKKTGLFLAGTKVGTWGAPIDDIRDEMSDYLLGTGEDPDSKMIATMTETGIRVWDLNGNSETIKCNNSQELIRRLEDPENPLRYVIVINRARSGINVHNFHVEVMGRLRDPKEIRTLIPNQIYGRMVRTDVGTGNIIRKEFKNNIELYINEYSKKYNVPVEVVIETIKVSNNFHIWYPDNPKIKRTWRESIKDFKDYYVNTIEQGHAWLDKTFINDSPKLSFLPINLEVEVECPCDGSKFMVNVNKEVEEWKGDGTLDAFFNIV
ncbi:MAG: DEAD/DEAH box helicase family protein [Candidatus Hodarchaeales archaeon]|jgi:hypothetical protein